MLVTVEIGPDRGVGVEVFATVATAVRIAATAFLDGLTKAQRLKTTFPVDDVEWRKWMNQSFYVRQGVSFKEMNEAFAEFFKTNPPARSTVQGERWPEGHLVAMEVIALAR